MKDVGARIAGAILAVIGIAAMSLGFLGVPAHAAAGVDQSAVGSLAQEETSEPDSSDSSEPQSDSTDAEDISDASDASDTTDSTEDTDEDQTDSPTPSAPAPTVTFPTDETPTDTPTETGESTGTGQSPLGWLLLGGGVLTAAAAYAVYRRGA